MISARCRAAALALLRVLFLVHLAKNDGIGTAPHGHAARADVLATAAEAGREFPLLVGRRRGDGRDERLRALHGLGFHGLLRVDGGRVSILDPPWRASQGEVAQIFVWLLLLN